MRRILLCLFVIVAACRPPASHPVPPAQQDEGFPDLGPLELPADFLVELPFVRQRGLLVIEARADGLDRPLRLAIDSGAPTVLRTQTAEAMGMTGGAALDAGDPQGRTVQARPVQIPRLEIAGLEVRKVAAVTVDLPVLDRFCPPLDGLLGVGLDLGSGFLDRVATEIDPVKQTVRFADRGDKLQQGGHAAPLRRSWVDEDGEEQLVTALKTKIGVRGKDLWVTLDTGNNADTDVPRNVFESLGYRVDGPGVARRHGALSFSAGGLAEQSTWVARLDKVRLGDHELSALPVNVTDPEGNDEDILLGQGLLRRFVLVLDLPGKTVRYIPTAEAPSPDPSPELGFGWEEMDGKIRVLSILTGGAAEEAGVKIGDEVRVVAGVDVAAGDAQTMCDARKAEHDAPDPVPYLLHRGDADLPVSLSRRAPLPPR